MGQTFVGGEQINRTWRLSAASLGLVIMGGATVASLFTGKNGAGVVTSKELSDGTREQSGSLLIQSGSNTLWADSVNRKVGVRTRNPRAEFDVNGAMSGNSLFVSRAFSGAGLTDCDNATSSKMLYDLTTGRFSCGTDQSGGGTGSFGTGNVLTLGDARYVNQSGDTMTGALTINVTGGGQSTVGLNVLNTVSGAVIRAQKTLASSGSVVWEGSASGASLWVSTFEGAGLTDCDAASQTLAWDATSKRYVCGTDSDTTYTAGQGLTLNGSAFVLNGTLTGTLLRYATVSGSLLYAKSTLASSGTLVVEGAISGASLFVGTSLRGVGLADCDTPSTSKLLWDDTAGRFSCGTDTDTNTTYTAGQGLQLNSTSFRLLTSFTGSVIRATTTLASSGTFVFEGAGSGSSLYVATAFEGVGLTDCDNATNAKLLWDATTRRFSCGTDQTGGGGSLPAGGSTGQILVHQGVSTAVWRSEKTYERLTLAGPQVQAAVGSGATFAAAFSGVLIDAHLQTSGVGSGVGIQFVINGTRAFSTVLSTDNKESSSTTAATPVAISSSAARFNKYATMRVDVTAVGSLASTGVYLTLWFNKTSP